MYRQRAGPSVVANRLAGTGPKIPNSLVGQSNFFTEEKPDESADEKPAVCAVDKPVVVADKKSADAGGSPWAQSTRSASNLYNNQYNRIFRRY